MNYVPCQPDEFLCSSGYGCLEQHLVCDSVPQCLYESDELGCNLCGDKFVQIGPNTDIFNITSPFYPKQFSLTLDCSWQLTTSTPGSFKIIIQDLDTSAHHDELYIGPANATILYDVDGQEESKKYMDSLNELKILIFTGRKHPKSLVLHTNELKMGWDSSIWSAGGRGFWIDVSWTVENASCESDEFVCPVGLGYMCLHLHQKCDGLPLCPYDYDELDCGNCGARNIYLQPDVPLNFTSPLYPANYPSNLNCKWTFIATETMVILVQIHEFGLERGFDFLTVGDGDVLGENVIGRLTGNIKLKSFTSAKENLWMELTTDKTGNWLGFRLLFSEIKPVEIKDVCKASAFDCGSGFCLDSAAQCDGFIDCVINRNDEKHCSDIQCPGSYPCQKVSGANISTCVNIEEVCDGDIDCSAGDDEIQCDIKRCPTNCECEYQQDILQVICANGWSQATIAGVARTTNAIDLSQNPLTILESSMFEDLPLLEEL
ncbi:membrane frizzled-related protein-like [Amphiura filiformis]|uniref:membrane frizzled-related protein-like n=1 Tax=Amphiura filiformis TaxID=82378 RepID=UPI003B21F416